MQSKDVNFQIFKKLRILIDSHFTQKLKIPRAFGGILVMGITLSIISAGAKVVQGFANTLLPALTFNVKGSWNDNDTAHQAFATVNIAQLVGVNSNGDMYAAYPYEYIYSITPNSGVNSSDMAIYEIASAYYQIFKHGSNHAYMTYAVTYDPGKNLNTYNPSGLYNYYTPSTPSLANPTMYAADAPLCPLGKNAISTLLQNNSCQAFVATVTLNSYPLYKDPNAQNLVSMNEKTQAFIYTAVAPDPDGTGSPHFSLSSSP